MKKIIIVIVFVLLTSCSSLDTSRIAPGYPEAFSAIKNVIFGFENEPIPRDLINAIPYASSLLKIGKGPEGLIILESVRDQDHLWVSADNVYLVIRNGKIIQTSGLTNNLTKVISPFKDKNFLELKKNRFKNYLSFSKPTLRDLPVEVHIEQKGQAMIQILDQERSLTLISEKISNDYIGWNVENLYWVDNEGFVWRSEQYISPKLPKFIIQVTKKPSL